MDQKELKLTNEFGFLVDKLGYSIVKVSITESKDIENNILQVMIAKEDKKPITINDCRKVSKEISNYLDNNGDLLKKYTLEVSSAGINRPLVFLKDFIEYKGSKVNIQLRSAINNLEKLEGGIISDVKQDIIKYKKQDQEFEVLLSNIHHAELDFDFSLKNN